MSDIPEPSITLEEAIKDGPDSTDPAYLAWKQKKIRAAVKYADEHPDEFCTLDDMAEKLRKKTQKYDP